MQHQLIDTMLDRVVSGLQRKQLTKPSRWAMACRVMGEPYPGKWNFKHHPWLLGMHDSTAEMNVGQKSAQMGYTETVLNLTFYNIDVKNVDCLYVLPAKTPGASNFSAGRFDRALELSPHLASMFSDVKNVGHKRAGSANLYIRGSRARSGLKEIPVGFIVLDEVDEMLQANIPLALERASGQVEWMAWLLSTPTIPGTGINKYYVESSQEHFHFKCPCCSVFTELIFPESVVICGEDEVDPELEKSHYICKECKNVLDHGKKIDFLFNGKWIESFKNRSSRGFHVNQLYSSARAGTAPNIVKSYFRSLKDPAEETEFYNSKLGLPHTVAGAQLNDEDIANHTQSYRNGKLTPRGIVTMGIDVGKYFHFEITDWIIGKVDGDDFSTDARARILLSGKHTDVNELSRLMLYWGISQAVIDANPDGRVSIQFANKHFGRVRLCTFNHHISGKDVHPGKMEEHNVQVNRTSWLDLALGRFRRPEAIIVPMDIDREFKEQLKVPCRIYKKDKDGNSIAYYESSGKDDHYAFARLYNEVAFKLSTKIGAARTIQSPL